mmetsp:Transcript_22822/g.40736  ORF Transcript_22822/g.40736 Transcript_22822/m.40736 type:complete len:231 (+) Transcript_22822:502-1194(+)
MARVGNGRVCTRRVLYRNGHAAVIDRWEHHRRLHRLAREQRVLIKTMLHLLVVVVRVARIDDNPQFALGDHIVQHDMNPRTENAKLAAVVRRLLPNDVSAVPAFQIVDVIGSAPSHVPATLRHHHQLFRAAPVAALAVHQVLRVELAHPPSVAHEKISDHRLVWPGLDSEAVGPGPLPALSYWKLRGQKQVPLAGEISARAEDGHGLCSAALELRIALPAGLPECAEEGR